MKWITVGPAYGKDYKSQKEVMDAYHSGADFQVLDAFSGGGSYVSKGDHPEGAHLTVRYNKNMRTHVISPRERNK